MKTADNKNWDRARDKFVKSAKRPTDKDISEEFGVSMRQISLRKNRGNWEALRAAYWDKVNALLSVTPSQAAKEIQERQDATAKAALKTVDAVHALIDEAVEMAARAIRSGGDPKEAIELTGAVVDLYKKATGGSASLIGAIKPDIPVELLKALREKDA